MSLKISAWGASVAGLSASQAKYAAGMATAAMTSYVVSQVLHLSGSYWAVLSAVIVFRFDFGNAFGASRDRLIGTVAGAVLAVSFLSLARLWSLPGFVLLAAIIVPLSFLAARWPQYRTALVTSIIVLSAGGPATGTISAATGRVLAVGLGAFIGGLFSFIVSFAKHPAVGHEPAAKIILGLGGLLPLSRRPDDTGSMTELQRAVYGGLRKFSSAPGLRLPEASPIVRILTRVYWDVVFIGRVNLATPDLEDKAGLQAALEQVAASFRNLCMQMADSLRHAKPLPTLIDFNQACSQLGPQINNPIAPDQGQNGVVSLLQLLRQDFESLFHALAETQKRGGIESSH